MQIIATPAARRNCADRVLALLRENTPTTLQLVEALIGKPIQRCPPARACAYTDSQILNALRARLGVCDQGAPLGWDRVVVVAVLPRPSCSRLSSENHDRFRPGATLARLMRDGISRKSIRRARREGWLVTEQRPCA